MYIVGPCAPKPPCIMPFCSCAVDADMNHTQRKRLQSIRSTTVLDQGLTSTTFCKVYVVVVRGTEKVYNKNYQKNALGSEVRLKLCSSLANYE